MVRPLLATIAVLALAGCTVGRTAEPTNRVAERVDRDHVLEVDLTGSMPTREDLGLNPGDTVKQYRGDPLTVNYRLPTGTFSVAASDAVVTTTFLETEDPRSPGNVPDSSLPPEEVSATQDVSGRDEVRDLLYARSALLGFDRDDVDLWYASAPPGPGPDVLLDETYLDGGRVGFADVSVGIFISTDAYVIWYFRWDPPLPPGAARFTPSGAPSATTT